MKLPVGVLLLGLAALLLAGASVMPQRHAEARVVTRGFLAGLARSGESAAQVLLAESFLASPQAPDYAAALHWYRQAAERGDAEAQFQLALMYEHGHGIAVDEGEALRWLQAASRQGDLRASCRLSLHEVNSVHVP